MIFSSGHRLTRDGAVFNQPTNQPSGIPSGKPRERMSFCCPLAADLCVCPLYAPVIFALCSARLAFTVLSGRGSEALEVLGEHIKLQVDELPDFTAIKGGYRVGEWRDPAGETAAVIVDLCGGQADAIDCY